MKVGTAASATPALPRIEFDLLGMHAPTQHACTTPPAGRAATGSRCTLAPAPLPPARITQLALEWVVRVGLPFPVTSHHLPDRYLPTLVARHHHLAQSRGQGAHRVVVAVERVGRRLQEGGVPAAHQLRRGTTGRGGGEPGVGRTGCRGADGGWGGMAARSAQQAGDGRGMGTGTGMRPRRDPSGAPPQMPAPPPPHPFTPKPAPTPTPTLPASPPTWSSPPV